MTTHEDRTELETRLRASLRERAEDVEVTPALYERVRRQASRGTWLRRGLAMAGAAAVVVAAVVVVPSLLPGPSSLDIADTPEDGRPAPEVTPSFEEDTEPSVLVPGVGTADPFLEFGLVYAEDTDGGSSVKYGDGSSSAGTNDRVVAMAAAPVGAAPQQLVMGLADGTIVVAGPGVSILPEASANGGGVAFSPDGQAIAWIDGTDLHIAPTSNLSGERVLPLEGDVPGDLRIEQWFRAVDAPVILASEPGGGVWSIPMDESNVFNTAPTEEAFVVAPDAVDSVLLPDLRRVDLVVDPQQGPVLSVDGEQYAITVPEAGALSDQLELSVNAGDTLVLHDPATGTGHLVPTTDGAPGPARFSWQEPSISAVAALPGAGRAPVEEPSAGSAAALGLSTDAPLLGTSGRNLLVRTADGRVEVLPLYPEESEATLGRLAVRPGSTLDDGLVAVESTSEGETSVRFVALQDGVASPTGSIAVTNGPVTGLVWSEDGTHLARSDEAGFLVVSEVGDDGTLGEGGPLLDSATAVLDWIWTGVDDETSRGHITVAAGDDTGVTFLGVQRTDGQVELTEPVGAADRLLLDTHASPGAAVGPEVTAEVDGDGRVRLGWAADGDRFGTLAGPVDVGGAARIDVSGGQVIVQGPDARLLITFDGEVVDLPTAADWDVLD